MKLLYCILRRAVEWIFALKAIFYQPIFFVKKPQQSIFSLRGRAVIWFVKQCRVSHSIPSVHTFSMMWARANHLLWSPDRLQLKQILHWFAIHHDKDVSEANRPTLAYAKPSALLLLLLLCLSPKVFTSLGNLLLEVGVCFMISAGRAPHHPQNYRLNPQATAFPTV